MVMERNTRDEQWHRVRDTATELFAEHGFDDVTMAEIAEAAEVARATVFNYFGSKHALIESITEGVLEVWNAMLDDALADETSPTPTIMRRLCEEMGRGIESSRTLFRSVFREIARVQLGLDAGEVAQGANQAARERLIQLFERGLERRELNANFSAETLTDAFHSLTNGTITNWLYQDPTGPLTVRMQEAAEVFLAPVEKGTRR